MGWVGALTSAEKCSSGFGFGLEAVSLDVALFEVCVAVVEADGSYGAVAVEGYVVFEERRIAVVGLDAVEGAVDLWTKARDWGISAQAVKPDDSVSTQW